MSPRTAAHAARTDAHAGADRQDAPPASAPQLRAPDAPPDTTALVTRKEVVGAITGTLVRHGRRRLLDDDVPEVQTRALEAARRGPMPRDVGEWKALAATIAERFALDEKEKAETRRKYAPDLREYPGAFGTVPRERLWDPVDAKRYLAVLKDQFDRGEMPERGAEILWGVAEELSCEEIAEETGLTCSQVKGRIERMRRAFRRRLAEMGTLAALLVVGMHLALPAPANGCDRASLLRKAG
jgi:DNA-directed RNA polymerase specialized sigma24 family protein